MRNKTESHEQVRVARWLEEQKAYGRVLKFTSVPNSTWTPSYSVINRNQAEGLRKGFPDLIVLLNKPRLMVFIEMKAPRGQPSRVSDDQKEWLSHLASFPDNRAIVAYGADEAITYLSNLLVDVSRPKQDQEETDEAREQRLDAFRSFLHG